MSIEEKIQKVKKKLKLTPPFAGRNLTVFDDDIFITSYPKSGNTWTRFLISNLLFPDEEINFTNIEEKIPDIYLSSNKDILRLNRPRIVKSHEYFDPRYQKVILIVRDPRDVLVSTYFHYIKYGFIDESLSIEAFGKGFLSNQYNAVGSHNLLGSWGENVGSWLGARGDDNFLIVRYEDLKQDIEVQLRRIAEFLGADCSSSTISAAVENSSVKRMRALEKRETKVWPARQTKRKDIAFVRSAKAGGWKEELSDALAEDVRLRWESVMTPLGYV